MDIATQREQALTEDGNAEILNGRLDWLYQEEIYGRGRFRGYWWSPDSSRVAFLRLDERPVPEYTVADHIPYRPALEVTDYPKAGDPEPRRHARASSHRRRPPRRGSISAAYDAADRLIVNVGWTPDSRGVVHQVQNREQTWLDLKVGDVDRAVRAASCARRPRRGSTRTATLCGSPDGSFLWISERNGFRQLCPVLGTDGTPGGAGDDRGDGTSRRFYGEDGKGSSTSRRPSANAHRHGRLPHRPRRQRASRGCRGRRARTGPRSTPRTRKYIDVWSDASDAAAGAAAPRRTARKRA